MLHKFLCCSRCGGSPAAPTQSPPPGVTDRSFSFFLFPFFVRVTSKSKAPLLGTQNQHIGHAVHLLCGTDLVADLLVVVVQPTRTPASTSFSVTSSA